jgi:uncharacterized membrane protein HdeD (DUF308 family)
MGLVFCIGSFFDSPGLDRLLYGSCDDHGFRCGAWLGTTRCAGAGLVVLSFLTGKWSGFLLTLAAGVISVVTGIEILSNPLSGAVAITMTIGIMLIALGIYRSVASIVMQFPNWGWSLVSGIVDFALGAVLLRNWQNTSLWFLGLVIGIDLILHGFAWIMFSLRLHSLAGEPGITEAGRPAA